MKIVQEGKPQVPDKWWVGALATCFVCGCIVRYEETDRPRIQNKQAGMRCPTKDCKGSVHAAIEDYLPDKV